MFTGCARTTISLRGIKAPGLKPYLSALDAQGQRALLTEVRAELEKRYPIQPNGNLLFYFPRLFFTARK